MFLEYRLTNPQRGGGRGCSHASQNVDLKHVSFDEDDFEEGSSSSQRPSSGSEEDASDEIRSEEQLLSHIRYMSHHQRAFKEEKAAESMALGFLLSVSDLVILVIDRFQSEEKLLVEDLRNHMKKARARTLIVVHNYFDLDLYPRLLFNLRIQKENIKQLY